MNNSQINVKVDNNLKNRVEYIFNRLGLTTTQAVKIFFNKVVNDNGIPFDLKINEEEQIDWNDLNKETKKAILDTEENNPSKKFNTVEEMFDDMKIYVRD